METQNDIINDVVNNDGSVTRTTTRIAVNGDTVVITHTFTAEEYQRDNDAREIRIERLQANIDREQGILNTTQVVLTQSKGILQQINPII